VSLRMVGDFTAAARLDQDTLGRRRKILGGDHPFTLLSANYYGSDLRETGDLAASRNTLEATYTAYRQVLRDDHSRTTGAAKTSAVTLRRLGRVAGAARLIAAAVARCEAVLGRRHPTTVACRLELACARWAQGHHDEARAIAEEVYAAYRQRWNDH